MRQRLDLVVRATLDHVHQLSLHLGDTGIAGYSDIHGVSSPVGGPYLADGRAVDPNGDFTSATSTAGLNLLNTHNANGTWTLFLADLSGGNWQLTFNPTKFPSTHTNIYVYAHSSVTGLTTETVRGFNIVG